MKTTQQSQVSKKPRQRLSKKQLWFLNNVFEANLHITDALCDLRVRPATFQRWLTKPVFIERLRMHLNQYYMEARLELARSAPMAVSGLSFLTEKSLRHAEVRRACNDILNLHTQFAKMAHGSKQAKEGVVSDKFGEPLDNLGAVLDNFGAVVDKLGAAKRTNNRIIDAKTTINRKIPHQIPSKTTA